jgi:hypothetical protein
MTIEDESKNARGAEGICGLYVHTERLGGDR